MQNIDYKLDHAMIHEYGSRKNSLSTRLLNLHVTTPNLEEITSKF